MRSFGFKLRRSLTDKFNLKKLTLHNFIMMSMATNVVIMSADMVVGERYEPPANTVAAAVEFKKIEQEIKALPPVAEKTVRPAAADYSANPYQIAAQKISSQILLSPVLGEDQAAQLTQTFEKSAKIWMPQELSKMSSGSALFLKECRAAATVGNATPNGVASCAVQKYQSYAVREHTIHNIGTYGFLGSSVGLILLSVAGSAMRRRVDKEEEKIKRQEFDDSIDSLRDILKPKNPR